MKKKKTDSYNTDDIEEMSEAEQKTEDTSDALSEEEIAILKASIASAKVDRSKLPPHDTSEGATFLRLIRSNIIFTVAAIIVAAAIALSAVGGTVFLVSKLLSYHRDFTIVIGEDEPYTVDYNDAVIDDVIYIDLRKIAAHTGLTLSGSSTKMQFTSIKNGTYLLFENESEYAYINGGRTEMSATTVDGNDILSVKAYVTGDECLVPYTFLAKTVSETTMTFVYDEDTQTIYVRPKYYVYDGDVENRVMKDLLFVTDNFDVTLPETDKPTYTYTYAIDVSEYLSSIDTEYLMLANKGNSIGKYAPSRLTKIECPTAGEETHYLDYDAAIALYAMMLEMEAAGIKNAVVTSSYRSYNTQQSIYNSYVSTHMSEGMTREEAEAYASTYSARAGESEHQTGLCLDFTITERVGLKNELDESFENTEAFEWLSKNAYKYGFILRYPEDKVDTTGYKYEPWHYRFVGRQAASEIYFSGMCLEEYLSGQ
ncbi:MAG: D-alanyl-D-alanine carboxypeptidase family protein [Clostridia bacterium]|nr:D-alanyl-D-alanine carboxypeptidase family protein [Clostridia bacterium]